MKAEMFILSSFGICIWKRAEKKETHAHTPKDAKYVDLGWIDKNILLSYLRGTLDVMQYCASEI